MPKFLIVMACYDLPSYIEDVLAPWKDDKDVLISVVHGVFPELAKQGHKIKNETIEWFSKRDYDFQVADAPYYEYALRNLVLYRYTIETFEYIWLLDNDEIYTKEQIKNIKNFVARNPFVDSFRINFKNYVGDETSWIDGFCPPRIWRVNSNGGLKGFYYDNDVEYKNGKKDKNLPSLTIPKFLAHVKHKSWCGDADYLKRKIAYQNAHFPACSYLWNEEKNCIDFNPEYHKMIGQRIPVLYKDNEKD